MSAQSIMWQTQQFLHKTPQVVPGTLLSVAGCLLVHRHMTEDVQGTDPLKTFLALIIIQMLPLVALELKIMSCADPVGLFCKFAMPVTLVHAVFLGLRLCHYHLYATSYIVCSALGLAGALAAIRFGFKASLSSVILCKNVWLLVLLSVGAALATESIDAWVNPPPEWRMPGWSEYLDGVLSTANNYIELMGFIPAVWMVYRQEQHVYDDVDSSITKRKATAFFLFLVGFYLAEDLFGAWQSWDAPAAACAHVVHFLMVCDFAFYVLAHIYNTDKLVGQLRKWLPADLACDV
jgi:hypothetical protein